MSQKLQPPAEPHYIVTVRHEGPQFIARDANGDWRTKGAYDPSLTSPRQIAEYLFHAEEIISVGGLSDDGSFESAIRDYSRTRSSANV